ncbi:MAG: DUF2905 domain-containing protein [Thermomicrobiales bacterium]
MDSRSVGLIIIGFGLLLVLLGLVAMAGGLSWFGRLPGDIRYESDNTRIYIPITSMILVSIVLSAVFAVVRRLVS